MIKICLSASSVQELILAKNRLHVFFGHRFSVTNKEGRAYLENPDDKQAPFYLNCEVEQNHFDNNLTVFDALKIGPKLSPKTRELMLKSFFESNPDTSFDEFREMTVFEVSLLIDPQRLMSAEGLGWSRVRKIYDWFEAMNCPLKQAIPVKCFYNYRYIKWFNGLAGEESTL